MERVRSVVLSRAAWYVLAALLCIGLVILEALFSPPAAIPAVATAAGTGSVAQRPPIMRPHSLRRYSSFECSGGSQQLLTGVRSEPLGFPLADSVAMRVCVFRDVCTVRANQSGGETIIAYYEDPETEGLAPDFMRLETAFPRGMLYVNFIDIISSQPIGRGPWRPEVVHGPIPEGVPFAPNDKLYIFDDLTDPSNYAHFLMDTIASAWAAADLYGVNMKDVQLVGAHNCDTCPRLKEIPVQSGTGWSTIDQCKVNADTWLPLLLIHPYIFPPHAHDRCYSRLVVGAGSHFGLAGQYTHRGATFRKMREHVLNVLGVRYPDTLPRHKVIVYEKRVEMKVADVPNICGVTLAMVKAATMPNQAPEVVCVTPADMSIEQQLKLAATASVFVVEHGSTSYISIFHPPGTSLVILVPAGASHSKEAGAMLYNTDVQAWYVGMPRVARGDGTAAMRLAMRNAAARLNIPPMGKEVA